MQLKEMQMQNCKNSWNNTDIENLAKMLTMTYKGQNTYKEPLDIADRVLFWRFVLEEKYTMDQVFYAVKEFVKNNSNMPVPADINNILNPPKPEISQAEYIAAKDWQKRNGYPMFSDALDTIQAYEKQEQGKREDYKSKNEEINAIAKQTARRLSCQAK